MKRLIVGAPVKDRAWILPSWFDHLAVALEHETPTSEVGVVLVGATDDPSYEVAHAEAAKHSLDLTWVESDHDETGPYKREWTYSRYKVMAHLRNMLLQQVREAEPEYFWSLDTDILVNEICLSSAVQAMREREFDAVGMKLYMTPKGRSNPSYGILPSMGGIRRSDCENVIRVDAIMASKLMSQKAYNIDYMPNRLGEDIGWSINARKKRLRLGWDGTNISKHVYNKDMLKCPDQRCGF